MAIQTRSLAFLCLLAGGCAEEIGSGGEGSAAVIALPNVGRAMPVLFPFDGLRTWNYYSTDDAVTYQIVAEMRSDDPEVVGGVNVYAVDYVRDCVLPDESCVDGVVRSVSWASIEDGVFVYSWSEGDDTVDFDPPLQVADAHMFEGDVVETETGGATWSATFVDSEACPDRFQTDIGDCARISIDDGDGDPETGAGLVGDYWAIEGFNVTGIDLVGENGAWTLSRIVCATEETCDGTW